MSQHVEIEIKNLLTETEFTRIKKYFQLRENDFVLQENQYFDTPDFQLKQKGCALRIRRKNGAFEFTLKEPNSIGLLETNEKLSEEKALSIVQNEGIPKGEIYSRLQALNINIPAVIYFGTLKTSRAELEYMEGLLVLDKSSYLNKEDYELEYEVNEPVIGEKYFLELLQQFQIPKRKTDNKIVRFYREKMHQDENKH